MTQNLTIDVGFSASTLDELLVELHDAQLEYQGAEPEGERHAKARIVGVVANILTSDIAHVDRKLATDVLLGLIRQAEQDLREALSLRLSAMEGVPHDVVLFLAHDIMPVAEPVLKYSPCLSATDLLYIIQSKGADYWRAIAERRALQDMVVSALVDKRDHGTALNLLMNETVTLSENALEVFAELSRYSDQLSEPLLNRPELPQSVALSLFWHVSDILRAEITKRFELSRDKIDAALQDALQDYVDSVNKAQEARPTPLMKDIARQYSKLNRINEAVLVKTLRRGQVRFFVALFAELTGLAPQTVFDLMRQIGGQGMAVACRAVGISKESFVSLFLLSRSIAHADQAMDAGELRKAIKYYDLLTEPVARQILRDSRTA